MGQKETWLQPKTAAAALASISEAIGGFSDAGRFATVHSY
jgi:hypothetical protein